MKPFTIAGIEPVSAEPYDSNNAWGFGGIAGSKMTYPNGAVIISGVAFYRHLPHHGWVNVYNKEGIKVFSAHKLNSDNDAVIKAITEKGATNE